ncbi:MAG: hypothetical protein ABJA94_04990, partial [Rhodoglobus sp.]
MVAGPSRSSVRSSCALAAALVALLALALRTPHSRGSPALAWLSRARVAIGALLLLEGRGLRHNTPIARPERGGAGRGARGGAGGRGGGPG